MNVRPQRSRDATHWPAKRPPQVLRAFRTGEMCFNNFIVVGRTRRARRRGARVAARPEFAPNVPNEKRVGKKAFVFDWMEFVSTRCWRVIIFPKLSTEIISRNSQWIFDSFRDKLPEIWTKIAINASWFYAILLYWVGALQSRFIVYTDRECPVRAENTNVVVRSGFTTSTGFI